MKWILSILWLLAGTSGAFAEDAVHTPQHAIQTFNLDNVLSAWKSQAADPKGWDTEWVVVRQLRSGTLGSPQTTDDSRKERLIRIRVQNGQVRLDATSVPPVALRRVSAEWNPRFIRQPLGSREFRLHLGAGFSSPSPIQAGQRYLLLTDRETDWHLWEAGRHARAVAAKCPAGASATCFDVPSMVRLAEAILCAVGTPPGLTADETNSDDKLLPEIRRVRGVACRVLKMSAPRRTGQGGRQYWIESGPEYRIRRIVAGGPRKSVVQFEYSEDQPTDDARRSIPRRISLLQFSERKEVEDELIVTLKEARRIKFPAEVFRIPPVPKGGLLTDFITEKRMVATESGVLRNVSLEDMMAEARLDDLDVATQMLGQPGTQRSLIEQVVHWISWPWGLIPLSAGCGMYGLAGWAIRRRRNRSPRNLLDLPQSGGTGQ